MSALATHSDTAPPDWRAPGVRRVRAEFETQGLAAVPVGGDRAWPGSETAHQAKVACNSIT